MSGEGGVGTQETPRSVRTYTAEAKRVTTDGRHTHISLIYIFDRYGKLLKQLSPLGSGWDGTFNGKPLPATDYWFTVKYEEPGTEIIKTFRAHFSLKR